MWCTVCSMLRGAPEAPESLPSSNSAPGPRLWTTTPGRASLHLSPARPRPQKSLLDTIAVAARLRASSALQGREGLPPSTPLLAHSLWPPLAHPATHLALCVAHPRRQTPWLPSSCTSCPQRRWHRWWQARVCLRALSRTCLPLPPLPPPLWSSLSPPLCSSSPPPPL